VRRALFLSGAAAACFWPARGSASDVQTAVANAAQDLPGTLGVCARALGAQHPIVAYRAAEVFPTASIIKVLIMATVYSLDEATRGILSHELVFDRASDLIGGSDFMTNQPDGARFTVGQLIVPMIQLSDNTAANMLIGYIGRNAINEAGKNAGLKRTHLGRKFLDSGAVIHHHDNVTTPADMARLLYVIETGAHEGVPTIASVAHCRRMVTIMLGQTDREKIPAALPRGTQIANKTGELTGTRNDVAIVNPFGDAPLVLAILTKDATDYGAANAAIHAVARAVYASFRGFGSTVSVRIESPRRIASSASKPSVIAPKTVY
jgi:beta-lactamase class A